MIYTRPNSSRLSVIKPPATRSTMALWTKLRLKFQNHVRGMKTQNHQENVWNLTTQLYWLAVSWRPGDVFLHHTQLLTESEADQEKFKDLMQPNGPISCRPAAAVWSYIMTVQCVGLSTESTMNPSGVMYTNTLTWDILHIVIIMYLKNYVEIGDDNYISNKGLIIKS